MGINLAKIQATREAEAKDAELQKAVETKRAAMQLEKRRATDVVQSKIERESAQEKADAKLYAENKNADGHLYKQKQDADAKYLVTVKGADALVYQKKQEAEADYYQTTKEAEALFYAKKKEAEGIAEMAKAYERLAAVLGGPQGLIQYMMIQDGTYEKLAKANAQALNNLQPKITVWNTGEHAGGADSTAPIRNLLQSLPPLLGTINDQTGIKPPGWLAEMPQQELPSSKALVNKKDPRVNGTGDRSQAP